MTTLSPWSGCLHHRLLSYAVWIASSWAWSTLPRRPSARPELIKRYPPRNIRSAVCFSLNPSESDNVEDDDDSSSLLADDIDDLWFEDPLLDDFASLAVDEPEAFLSDEDLTLLNDIDLPLVSVQSTELAGNDNATASARPQILSTQDLSRFSPDVSYFYLRDELGLGEDVMWKIMNQAGSLLGLKASTLRTKVELLQKTIKLSDDDLRQLLSSHPGILQRSANKSLSPTILFLVRQLDLGIKDLRTLVLGCPAVLTYSIPNLQKKLEFFINTLGCSVEDTRTLLLKEPMLLTCSPKEGLRDRYRFLHKELDIPRPDIRTMVQKNPRILRMSVDQNLQPKLIFFMIMTLMLSPDDVRKLLLKFPGILNYNLDDHILPITRYFLSLDISAKEIAHMLLKFPRLVTNSLAKIKYVVGYLRFELCLDADGVRRILYQAPQVLSLAPSNLERKVDYLLQVVSPGTTKSTVDEETREVLSKLIVGMPSLLYLSIDKNLEPKVEYLRPILGSEGFIKALGRLPMLLAYSLENRIRPRLEQILHAGIGPDSITVGIPKGEAHFQKWLDARIQKKGETFASSSGSYPSAQNAGSRNQSVLIVHPKGGSRLEEDGGKITHWTRPRR